MHQCAVEHQGTTGLSVSGENPAFINQAGDCFFYLVSTEDNWLSEDHVQPQTRPCLCDPGIIHSGPLNSTASLTYSAIFIRAWFGHMVVARDQVP